MFVLGHEHLVFWKQPLCGLLIWVFLTVPHRHKMTQRPYQQRPRIRILHFLEFKLLDLRCQFPNNQINQQDTGRVLLLSKSVGFFCHPQSTFWSFWLVQTHFDIEVWKPFCTQHHTKMASNSGDDWRSMAFRQKVLSQMYVLVISRRQIAFVKQRVSFIVWLCQQTVI